MIVTIPSILQMVRTNCPCSRWFITSYEHTHGICCRFDVWLVWLWLVQREMWPSFGHEFVCSKTLIHSRLKGFKGCYSLSGWHGHHGHGLQGETPSVPVKRVPRDFSPWLQPLPWVVLLKIPWTSRGAWNVTRVKANSIASAWWWFVQDGWHLMVSQVIASSPKNGWFIAIHLQDDRWSINGSILSMVSINNKWLIL